MWKALSANLCVCGSVLTYRVEVYTGYLPEAGTDAKVHLMLIGERGDTGYRQLLKPISADLSRPFQSGQVSTTPYLSANHLLLEVCCRVPVIHAHSYVIGLLLKFAAYLSSMSLLDDVWLLCHIITDVRILEKYFHVF